MIRILLTILMALSFSYADAQLKVNPLFQDHALLQRDVEVPIKGTSKPGANINIELANTHRVVTADRAGKWRVLLPQMKAGGPYEIRIESPDEQVILSDVYFGDVWLCSGQSNMEWPVSRSNNAAEEVAAAGDVGLRHIKIPHSGGTSKHDTIGGGIWQVDNQENAGDFTGVGYFFARHLRANRDVPIGLLHSSWGGSRIEPWMRAEILGYDNNAQAAVSMHKDRAEQESMLREKMVSLVGELTDEDLGMNGDDPIWAAVDHDITDWKKMQLPGLWEDGPLPKFDGIVWYAIDINIESDQVDQTAILNLGKIDDSDHTYVNGQLVGHMSNQYATLRTYTIPSGVLKSGENRIVIRVEDTGGGGGVYGEAKDLSINLGSEKIDLDTDWSYKPSAHYLRNTQNVNHQPTLLYNHMIHPLLDFPIAGVIWYQGESNADPVESMDYGNQLKDMITDWRKLWNKDDLPFLSVQLANFRAPDAAPNDGGWQRVREGIADVSDKLINTGDAVIIDIGDPSDIHPTNKQEVGRRLGLLADHIVYGDQDIVWNSPRYKEMEVIKDRIVVSFDHVGSGLVNRNKFGYIHGFEVAGEDQRYYWAKAELIANDKIAIHSDRVDNPIHVRYAWGINPDVTDIYNDNNLPLSPFRTDEWGFPTLKFLALGDSFTAGTSVEQSASFPYQLSKTISTDTRSIEVDVVAKNGWTTRDLLDSLSLDEPSSDYDMVTLLIGVNNQYQGKPIGIYEIEFEQLLNKAIDYAGGDPLKVVVLSIPDYAFTPYGQTRPGPINISRELDQYNAFAEKMASKYGTHDVYITDITRNGLKDKELVAKDKLHPSGKSYKLMTPRISKALGF